MINNVLDQALPKQDGENPNPHPYPSATSKSRGMASEDKIVSQMNTKKVHSPVSWRQNEIY